MEFWHLCGRGVEKRDIVADDSDRLRFIHDLYAFNDRKPALNYLQPERQEGKESRERLVDIHAYALMNNHYHLFVSERTDGGISSFMQKLNMGYAKYFNDRYQRSGSLWQGKYRKVVIRRDAHFLYIPYYIHLNPLDYVLPGWRKGSIKSSEKAIEALLDYRWSSFQDYFGKRNFPSVIKQSFLQEVLGSQKEQRKVIADIISDPTLAEESTSLEFRI